MFLLFDIPLLPFPLPNLIGLLLLMISFASLLIKLSLQHFLLHFYNRLWIKGILKK